MKIKARIMIKMTINKNGNRATKWKKFITKGC